jgi:hypothetical protein
MRIQLSVRLLVAAICLAGMTACATTQTQMGTVSAQDLAQEADAQRRFVIETGWANESRVDRLVYPLSRVSVELCGLKARPEFGARLAVQESWSREYRGAAAALGVSDTVTVTQVTPGTSAATVLQPGDRILTLNGKPVGIKSAGLTQLSKAFRAAQERATSPVRVVFARPTEPRTGMNGGPVRVDSGVFTPDVLCSGLAEVVRDDAINAYADGKLVYVTTGMLRFANDEELQIVLGHEIAHNAERHIEAKQKNAGWGALLGAIADVALATQGVNTQGAYSEQFAQLAGMSFSQDFEREADYVGSYILARANLSTERAPLFWRRMAAESPGSIKFASSHPTSTERFVRLGQYHSEIQAKRASGGVLTPNMKKEDK